MKRFLQFALLLATAFLVFISCQKTVEESPTANTTVAEDKAFITTTYNNTINCIKGVRDGDCSQALISFLAISNNVIGNETWINEMTSALDTSMGFPQLDPNNSRFDFPAYRGTYDWNRTTKKFTKTTSTTGIFINFPSDPSKLTNNTSIRFTTYTDAQYQANSQTLYLPTAVKATLTKDNVELVNVDGTGLFSNGNFPAPINVVCSITLKPHVYKITVTRLTNVQFSTKLEIGGDCGSVIDGKVTFLNDDYNNFDAKTFLGTIQGTYTKGNLNIVLNWDAKTYYAFNNPTTANLNSTISCVVNNGPYKIGDLKFKDVSGVRKVYIYYKDGTSEDIAVYNDPFLTQLKDILRPYFGNEVDTWF